MNNKVSPLLLFAVFAICFPGMVLAADSDGDGLTDDVETNTGVYVSPADTGTNPYKRDTDGDGVGDWYEVVTIDVDPADPQPNSPNDAALFTNIPYPLPAPDSGTPSAAKPVKVYILSGQSNMEGRGRVSGLGTLGTLETITKIENKFPYLLNGSSWAARSDVTFQQVYKGVAVGPLSPDFASNIGPEMGFGHVMGNYHDEPVLLIKSAQGGRSLGFDFRPPGSTQYTDGAETFAGYGDSPAKWTTGSTPVPEDKYAGYQYDLCFKDEADWAPPTGAAYSPLVNVVDVLDNFATEYPQWASQGFEIAGFVWWQGYNDKQGSGVPLSYSERYGQNMAQFINEIRDYYEARYPGQVVPDAPFVLGTLGESGWSVKTEKFQNVLDGQLSVDGSTGNYPAFSGNVKTMETRSFWRDTSISPSAQGHHYNSNAETYMLAGDALGRAMIDLINGNTTDTTPPERFFFDPVNGETLAPSDGNLVITFNEPIAIGSGNIIVKNLTDGTQTVIAVSDTSQVSAAGFALTIHPSAPLTVNKTYAIQMASGAVTDLDANVFPGISDDTTWSFHAVDPYIAPDTPSFTVPAVHVSDTSITLGATTVTDYYGAGVEYRFHNLTLGTDSGWLPTPEWTESGLSAGTTYIYTVQSRDVSLNFNESAQSSPLAFSTLRAPHPYAVIADIFIFTGDLANDSAYSSNPGADSGLEDNFGADKPITIPVNGFTSVGSDKLVGVVNMYNTGSNTSAITGLTYGGVDVLTSNTVFYRSSGSRYPCLLFYVDNPTVDGDLVISLEAEKNVDEVGVALFALNGTSPGHGEFDITGDEISPSLSALEGDFVLGSYVRNNGTSTVSAPFNEVDLKAGNMNADVAYIVANADGLYQPVYSGGSSAVGAASSIARFPASTADVLPYDIWAETNLPRTGGDLSADEDLDGVANGIEYVLGGNSATNDRDKLPTAAAPGTDLTYTFVRDQASVDGSAVTFIEVGSTLSTWPDIYLVGADTESSTAGVTVTDNLDGTDTIVLTIPRGSDSRKFARLNFIVNP